jgi:crotonobetainyl-CoA:carnitine CoA-transferase CaiB-like acyl-CoA transferase
MSEKNKEQILVRYGGSRKERETFLKAMMSPDGKPEVLDDAVILDVSYANLSGDICSSIFAEFGAEVIKIEPAEGDPSRKITPYGVNRNGVGVPFIMEARNKRYMTIDLRTEKGREEFKNLVKKAHVVIETYEPGKMDAWGIGYRQLSEINPSLVYIAISPYGQYGEKAREMVDVPDSDITAQAASGVPANIGDMPGSGEPWNWPLRAGVWLGWYISGVEAALGGAIARYYTRETGQGQMVDVASSDSYVSLVGYPVTIGFTWDKARPRIGKHDFAIYPYGFWKSKDGIVAIAAGRDHDFRALLKVLNLWKHEDDYRFTFDRIPDILTQIEEFYKIIEEQTMKHTSAELVKMALEYSIKSARSKWRGGGVPIIMEVQKPATTRQNPHWLKRQDFKEFEDATLGKFNMPVNFIKMSESPPRLKWVKCNIGQDNNYIRDKYLK